MSEGDAVDKLLAELSEFERAALEAFERASDAATLEAARVRFLGQRRGWFKQLEQRFRALPREGKRTCGPRFNEVRSRVREAFSKAQARLEQGAAQGGQPEAAAVQPTGGLRFGGAAVTAGRAEAFDFTVPGKRVRRGTLHPLTHTIEELIRIFGRLGFELADGPEVEDEWHNFEALNIPPEHPARDPNDNFYLDPRRLLRSQTSTVQIRVMERQRPPVRIIAIGRVYRPDVHDATHFSMFHQIEGLYVDRHVTLAHLKTVLRQFAQAYLGPDVQIRFRPSFFPFTEPSVEVDMSWDVRGGQWVELGGAGMVDPNVFRAVGYDPEEYTGFAFGLGVERLCMRRHGIHDIRLFYENDVRFLKQF